MNKQVGYQYQSGLRNTFSSEALPGALPLSQNTPQKVPYGLYPEQLSGTAFTAPRAHNARSWLYRIRPSAAHHVQFKKYSQPLFLSGPFSQIDIPPNQLRWSPPPIPENNKSTDFIDGIITFGGNGDPSSQGGLAIHLYAANCSMKNRYFYNADGEMLILPQEGSLLVKTEFGIIEAKPGEIMVIPRGVHFSIELPNGNARGYIGENYGAPFQLPELGPIGSNGLANPRDFKFPVAAFEDREGEFQLISKFSGQLWVASLDRSPLDVVAWSGNYAPYKYDLSLFNTINTVSYDHPDPSIFCVLTSPSDTAGTANCDFVIFPPRWMVAEHTFRPPWYHRNIMSEYMGLILGTYDAKPEGGFLPGGGSLHNCMIGHGPDAIAYEKGSKAALVPEQYKNTMAFMLETRLIIHPTPYALNGPLLQNDYLDCWKGLKKNFNGKI